ncbi:hypothetical protein F5148DRAFT_1146215 [Russula earlei]|uniref:Uncharacterized protein n=1 Tax=Russula earlei TaxID=71964 RepID=A0ACC0ULB3_9AGAM|nr:hypothetical protein F5148DRAFT_1146215 [Russula earlei]
MIAHEKMVEGRNFRHRSSKRKVGGIRKLCTRHTRTGRPRLSCRLSSACVRLRTKQPPEKFFGGSIILMGFLVGPRVPFATAFVIDGNGRRGREAGNDGFRVGRGRGGVCRDGEVGEASGDETRGRVVLTTSDMTRFLWFGKITTRGQARECGAGEWILGIFEGRSAASLTHPEPEREHTATLDALSFLSSPLRCTDGSFGRGMSPSMLPVRRGLSNNSHRQVTKAAIGSSDPSVAPDKPWTFTVGSRRTIIAESRPLALYETISATIAFTEIHAVHGLPAWPNDRPNTKTILCSSQIRLGLLGVVIALLTLNNREGVEDFDPIDLSRRNFLEDNVEVVFADGWSGCQTRGRITSAVYPLSPSMAVAVCGAVVVSRL